MLSEVVILTLKIKVLMLFFFPVRDFELDVLILRQGSEIFVPVKTQLVGDLQVL